MRSFLRKVVIAAGFAAFALGGTTRAQSWDHDGCSNATLNGDYAFTVSGSIFTPGGVVQRLGVAMTHFNGAGGLNQVDFVLSSPNAGPPPGQSPTDKVTGFHTEENGTYQVFSDCTGTFTIHFPDVTTPSGTISGAIIEVKFVLADRGRSIYTVVTSLTPPGAKGPVPALISSEGRKLGRVREE